MKPLPIHEKEYRESLLRTERRAIVPGKWFILVVTLTLWVALIRRQPGPAVLVLFVIYTLLNLSESYLIYFRAVGLNRIKPITLISYLADVVYVTLLIYFDMATYNLGETSVLQSHFYILYFLLVLRGFSLFSTLIEVVLVNSLISGLFILTLWLQNTNFEFLTRPDFIIQLVLIWLVVLMAWFIVIVLTQQRTDLIKIHDRLLMADNLARVGALASGVAHEINNPLGIIISNIEYMKKETDPSDPRLEEIEAIYGEANRCKDIVQQMLAYANPKPGEISIINAEHINDEVLQFIFPKGRAKNTEIVKEYDENLPPIRADPNLVKQALLNIYLNAQEAIAEGISGRIVSRVYEDSQSGDVTFEVEDNGAGIAPEDLDHIFDPFFTRKPNGTGLGLAMTQSIVESLNGTISLDPALPRGTRVKIRFPAVQT